MKAVEKLKRAGIKTLRDEEWEIKWNGDERETNICTRGGTKGGSNSIAL